jgi:esterase/lipase superfamily enzyme
MSKVAGRISLFLSARAGILLVMTMLTGGCAAELGNFSASAGGLLGAHATGAPRLCAIFVASTRQSEKSANDATADGSANFSLVTVSIPPNHVAGAIERPSVRWEDKKRHFTVVGRRNLDEASFQNELATHISGRVGSNRDVLLFVHGFNTSLDDARFRLAQIVTDARFGGVPVLFTWASSNNLLAYGSDKERATASRDAVENVIRDLSQLPGVGRIHVLAHSMGAWLAMEALRQNAIAGHPDLGGHLGEIMLAAPDIDLAVFKAQLARLGTAAHVSIFVASNDRALSLSSRLVGDRPRLGALDLNQPETRSEVAGMGVKVYDLTGESDPDFLHHGAYADVPQVIAAIGAQLSEPRIDDKDVTAVIDATQNPPPAESGAPAAPLPQEGPLTLPQSRTEPTGAPPANSPGR